MKRSTTIVLFASIFAVAVGTLGLSGNTSALMVSAVPQTQENMGILGHVEYQVLDGFGNVKGYFQNDNVVVVAGKDCASQYLFTDAGASVADCLSGNAAFTYIGIGNGTILLADLPAIGSENATLQDSGGGTSDTTADCAVTGAGNGGDMARRNVTATFVSTGSATVVTLDTSGVGSDGPFTFDVNNATDVTDSGLFNADYDTVDPATHICGGLNTANAPSGDWNMFSRQLLNNESGITVTDGDSLSVKWTITVG